MSDDGLPEDQYSERRQRSMRIVLSSGLAAISVAIAWLCMKVWAEEFFNKYGLAIVLISLLVLGTVSVVALAAFGERRAVDQLLTGALSLFLLALVVWFFSISGLPYLALSLMIGVLPTSLGVVVGHGIVCFLPEPASRRDD